MAKKGSGIESVHYPDVLESALCFGWIDGRREALDERYFLQRFTPRRPRSRWSRINCEKAERLIRQGRMRPAGLAEVERARADGRWEARVRGSESQRCARRSPARARPSPHGKRVLRRAEQPEPLRHPPPASGRQEAGDAGTATGEVRCDARGGRNDLSLGGSSPSTSRPAGDFERAPVTQLQGL